MFLRDWVLDTWEEVNHRRYVALVLLSLVPFGVFFAYDSLGALADFLEEDLGLSHTDIGLVYSAYSLPNCVGGLFYGLAIDRWGAPISMMIGHACIFVGCLCVALAGGLPLLVIGRMIFGLGGESFIVAQRKLIGVWFRDSKLSLAYTVSYCVPLMSTFLCFQLLPSIAEAYSLRRALLVCLFFCGAAWFFNVVYVIFEKFYSYKELNNDPDELNAEGKTISWASIKDLPYSYWMVCLITLCMYSTTWPFVALAVDMYSTKWGYSPEEAGRIASIFGIEGVVMGPLSSFFFDRYGYRVTGMVVSSTMIVLSFVVLGLTTISPIYATIVLGICLSITPATTYPCLPLIVPNHLLGTAFGILNLYQNVGLAIFPTVFGALAERAGGDFTNSCVAFACFALLGLCVSVALKINDVLNHHDHLDSVKKTSTQSLANSSATKSTESTESTDSTPTNSPRNTTEEMKINVTLAESQSMNR